MQGKFAVAILGLSLLAGWPAGAWSQGPESTRGEVIWKAKCVSCHGDRGQGVVGKFEHRLTRVGDLEELTTLINETMPEDNPGDCVGQDARDVAAFLLSDILQVMDSPPLPRRELLHLSTTQLENAIASLGESFLGRTNFDPNRHGLMAKYFDSKELDSKKLVLERIDSTIDVDYGDGGPLGDKTNKEEFSISWSGSIFVEETGSYEFSVTSTNGYRLFVNRPDEPLIDSWVATRDEPEKSAAIRLPGGRWYPFRLQATKVKDPSFSLKLRWRPPRRHWAIVPSSVLYPESAEPVLTTQVNLPADDSSQGFARGTLFSAEWDQATTDVGIELSQVITSRLSAFVGARPGQPEFDQNCREFCARFAKRAFRRELSEREFADYVGGFFADHRTEEAVGLSILAVIKSPWFQYLGLEEGQDRAAGLAEAISWAAQDDLPDPKLIQELSGISENNDVVLRDLIRQQLDSPAARAKWRLFFVDWLGVVEAGELRKDTDAFTGFEPELGDALQESLLRFVDEIWCHPEADFRRLLRDEHLWLNSRLQELYVADSETGSFQSRDATALSATENLNNFVSVAFSPEERAGLLTHPLLLSQLSYYRSTSPIHRGVFVTRQILGWTLKPPPIAVEPVGEEAGGDLTTRERVEMQTRPENCMSCHRVINPFGFALEGYDAIGRVRKFDREKPVDTSVVVQLGGGEQVRLDGARALAEFLVSRRETHRHFVQAVFQHATRQFPAAYAPGLLDELTDTFVESNFNMRELVVEIIFRTSKIGPTIASRSSN